MSEFPRLIRPETWGMVGGIGRQMNLPVSKVFLHHTVTTVTNNAQADMRRVNRIGVERFGRHSYSWNFWPDRSPAEEHEVLVGQGTHIGAHTRHQNSTSLSYCWIGNYQNDEVTGSMVRYTAAWHGRNIDKGIVTRNARLRPHRAVSATACPGNNWMSNLEYLYDLISDDYRWSMPTKTAVTAIEIRDAYQTFFERTANSNELGYWGRQNLTVTELHATFAETEEHKRLKINQFYRTLLRRSAAEDEILYWIERNLPVSEIEQGVMNSAEYKNLKPVTIGRSATDDLIDQALAALDTARTALDKLKETS